MIRGYCLRCRKSRDSQCQTRLRIKLLSTSITVPGFLRAPAYIVPMPYLTSRSISGSKSFSTYFEIILSGSECSPSTFRGPGSAVGKLFGTTVNRQATHNLLLNPVEGPIIHSIRLLFPNCCETEEFGAWYPEREPTD